MSSLLRYKAEEARRKVKSPFKSGRCFRVIFFQKEEEMTREVLKEFEATFQQSPSSDERKAFTRGRGVNPPEINPASSKSPVQKVSKSSSSFSLAEARKQAEENAKKILEANFKTRPQKPGKKGEEKRLSNLETFKEELKKAQEERIVRRRMREQMQDQLGVTISPDSDGSLDNPYTKGNYDFDPNTSNLFLSNLSFSVSENEIRELFGKFGPLASVKVLWPRNDEDRHKNRLTGFVAFMTRKDAQRAFTALKGVILHGQEIKLSWGKPVSIPVYPVYVPDAMMKLIAPPPRSGLPFNAQPRQKDRDAFIWPLPENLMEPDDPVQRKIWRKMIKNAVVKVVIPTDRPLLCIIHRMIEFVVREGPLFEAMVMAKESKNPMYSFLFDNTSAAHTYYRWKLFSILQGDSPAKWKTKKFRMFQNGSIWQPPPLNFFHNGMPEELYLENEKSTGHYSTDGGGDSSSFKSKRGQLCSAELVALEKLLEKLTMERSKVGDAMVWCVEHSDFAEHIVSVIADNIESEDTTLPKKVIEFGFFKLILKYLKKFHFQIALLYLLSDILANCFAEVMNVSYYRTHIENRLEGIFRKLHTSYKGISARLRAEQFRQRVANCCKMWEDTAVYPLEFLARLQGILLGIIPPEPIPSDIDGVALDEATAEELFDEYDIDGVPLDEDMMESLTTSTSAQQQPKAKFIRSRWEEVAPQVVREQAFSSCKWETCETEKQQDIFDADIDGMPLDEKSRSPSHGKHELSEHERQQLRELEVKVVTYQDALESGSIALQEGMTIAEQVNDYRNYLLKKEESKKQKRNEKLLRSSGGRSGDSGKQRHRSRKRDHEHEDRRSKRRHVNSRRSSSRSRSKKSSHRHSRHSRTTSSSSSSSSTPAPRKSSDEYRDRHRRK
ncbi:U2 snRNP-associated SURP motif-containing protein [Trichinella pseudospiralis]|uniref:U2 snRNP-associated SURP motif-containing protein n=1 Tax=Trichinella pseudospiralis TaxID=6337 RepID=A0A0V1IQB5_TRIPS|nr:U2 snRNP-associated SURP motif-containing protein [Trichinella pseudospiralis]